MTKIDQTKTEEKIANKLRNGSENESSSLKCLDNDDNKFHMTKIVEDETRRRKLLHYGSYFLMDMIVLTKTDVQAAELSKSNLSASLQPERKQVLIQDPETYSGLLYVPNLNSDDNSSRRTDDIDSALPLIIVLHGAGTNEEDAWNLANIKGEHAGLIPSLIEAGQAPTALTENFVVATPYSQGKASLYEEPRRKVLSFIDWICSEEGRKATGCPHIDPKRIFLFGFSDGATLAVELLTTKKFKAGIVAAYGFSGTLPDLALERLKGIPIWIFHSQDDVIYSVKFSDKLFRSLQNVNNNNIVKYSRFEKDQEGFTGRITGHSTGITASKMKEIYEWMLSLN